MATERMQNVLTFWVDAECADLPVEAECADLWVEAECTDLWVCLVPAACAPCSVTCRGGVGRRSGCWPSPCTWWCSWRSSAWCSTPAWTTGSGNRPWKPHTICLGREKKVSAVIFTKSTKVFIISLNLCYFHIPKIMKNVLRHTFDHIPNIPNIRTKSELSQVQTKYLQPSFRLSITSTWHWEQGEVNATVCMGNKASRKLWRSCLDGNIQRQEFCHRYMPD